jgi:hypothetical protein
MPDSYGASFTAVAVARGYRWDRTMIPKAVTTTKARRRKRGTYSWSTDYSLSQENPFTFVGLRGGSYLGLRSSVKQT